MPYLIGADAVYGCESCEDDMDPCTGWLYAGQAYSAEDALNKEGSGKTFNTKPWRHTGWSGASAIRVADCHPVSAEPAVLLKYSRVLSGVSVIDVLTDPSFLLQGKVQSG